MKKWSRVNALLLLLILATCGVAVGQTSTATATATRTRTATGTVTQTGTITQTGTVTATATATRTPTIRTPTATRTRTQTRTVTQTRTATATGTATTTILATATSTNTPVSTATFGSTPTPTGLTFKLILNDPLTDPPDLTWAKELVRRLSLPSFCDTSTCGGSGVETNSWGIIAPSAGDVVTSNSPGDTVIFQCFPPLICIGDNALSTIEFRIGTPTAAATATQTGTVTATHTPTVTATPYNAWSVIDAPAGTDPVADIPGDTFILTSSNCTITGDSSTDTVDFNCPGAGAASNSFETWDTPSGTDIVADSSTDTVQFLAAGIMAISGGGAADTITFTATEVDGSITNEIQNLFETFNAPAGTDPIADSATDIINLTAAGICTITGDATTDTLAWSCTEVDGSTTNELQNIFQTFNAPAGTDPVADTTTDSIDFLATGIVTITGDSALDTLTIGAIEVDGSTTNELQNLFQTIDTSSGTDPVADTTTDTLIMTGTSPVVVTGNSAADSVTYSWDFTVANTWTGLQTFDSGADWNDNDAARFGTGDDATILYNGTDLKVNPGPSQLTSFANRIELFDGGGTYIANATAVSLTDAITIDAVIGYAGLNSAQTVTLETDPSAFLEGSFVVHGNTYTNPSSEVRTFGPTFLMFDGGIWNPNTTTGATTKNAWYSLYLSPTVTKTGANSATLTDVQSMRSGLTLANSAIVTQRRAIQIDDASGTGTVTTQAGLVIGDLTFAGTNWSMQIGSAQSYHAGPMVLGAVVAPCTSCGLELESTTTALQLSRMTTANRNAMTAEDGMQIYNTTTLVTERRENGAWVSGGGASGNSTEVSIVLGDAGYYSTTVTGQAWVAVGSEITCSPFGTTANSLTPEVVAVADLGASASDRVVGTGFNLNVYNPYGLTGTVRFHCVGV